MQTASASNSDNREAAVVADRADTVAGDIADTVVGDIADTVAGIAGAANIDFAPSAAAPPAGLRSRRRRESFQTWLCRLQIARRDRLRAVRRLGDRCRRCC